MAFEPREFRPRASELQELVLTPDLLDFAKRSALKEAKKRCTRRIIYDDVVQYAMLQLLSRPPKFDPERGTSPKTLIYTIVLRAVIKYATREKQQFDRYGSLPRTKVVSEGLEEGTVERMPTINQISERRTAALTRSRYSLDDIFQFIDNEDSKALCRVVMECGGSRSKAARRLGLSEGTVRYRLKLLVPKLRAAGFDPFQGDTT